MLDNEPIAGAGGPDGDTTEQPTTTPRRRAASRPAGPPPEPAEPETRNGSAPSVPLTRPAFEPAAPAAEKTETAEQSGQPETSVAEDAAETAAPKRATRRRTASTATTTGAATSTTRRRTRKAAAEEEQPETPEPAPAEEEAAQAPEPVKRRRVRRKAAEEEQPEAERSTAAEPTPAVPSAEELLTMPVDEPLDDEPAGEDLDEENGEAGQESARPGVLADPFGLAAQAQLRYAEPAVSYTPPAAVFTPLFQAPEPRVGEALRPAAAPQPVREEEPAEEQVPEPEEAEEIDETEGDEADDDADEQGGGRRRRRRRGGRGRGKVRDRDDADGDDADSADAEAEEQADDDADDDASAGSRRRRRRRRRGSEEGAEPSADDPPNTVVRIRAPRAGRGGSMSTSIDEVQSVRGSTRLEAKKQRRREGRELGRRRPPIITESEFLARRESVERVMVVRRTAGRTQIAVLEDGVLVEHYVDREAGQSYVGNVYLGKVQNVLPSMEAAFVDIGKGRNAVLYAGEVNFDTAGLEGQPKRIEAALKSGQSVLVQVTKDPMGHKGARLTSQISLPGRYLVYVPEGSMTGISRKLPDKERSRLKAILKKVTPENAGVIVRTAAEGASEEELDRDVARLSAQWENIQRKAKSASPPELLYSEPDLTIRVVRDVFNEDFSSLVVAGDVWETVDEYVRYVAPHLADRVNRWQDDGDVFAAYRIDEQIAKALERKVWLPSGGSLVIDRTEAMTVVDVNTGKFTGQGGNLEETVTRNNLEAAEEIVRQLRLRDIGGIIVIDFIDMVLESNRDLVLRRLLECLARDRTKHQVAEVTSLGLVQMTRKRVGQGLLEAFSTPCECCNGRGLHVSTEPAPAVPEPRGTQGKMAIEKAVAGKLSKNGDATAVAAGDQAGRDTVTDALGGDRADDDQSAQVTSRGRRRSRRTAKQAD
ncbi:Rne/Rng family ribonuclease [Spongiactinospora sp. TRM90649]|uniref:Rne/Rng family ribonuclease n=1 Tax=Spongiactinospora sp. TRM90649 TaxID=3031114 RepID=UPI0023F8E49E|nr:Rne/Rng family ribonuclease [Spongiactinospora sp. TRM90649]MDF5755268.1 Rne/Rng family ribonuclease [Spongiactinospora sp. TRM90649]